MERVNYWEIIAANLSKAGWSWGCVSAVDSSGRTIWIVDAHRDGRRFVVRANEKTAPMRVLLRQEKAKNVALMNTPIDFLAAA